MKPRIVYAANREIGHRCLQMLLERGCKPAYALYPSRETGTWIDEMESLIPDVPSTLGKPRSWSQLENELKEIDPHLLLSVHYPLILPSNILDLPEWGALNLHPALLPYNRGWHTPSWAILEDTPIGATLHWMNEEVDSGPIAAQRPLEIGKGETAHGLYQRVLKLEEDLFREALPALLENRLPREPQKGAGTMHRKQDLRRVQTMDLDESGQFGAFIDQLRALTTNDWDEAVRFKTGDGVYAVRVELKKLGGPDGQTIDRDEETR